MQTETTPYIHPILCDGCFTEALDRLGDTLQEMRLFWKNPKVPMQKRPADYVQWLKELGASKQAIKWLLPLCTATTPRSLALLVFGRDLSPIEELGDRSVSAFIRFLMFSRNRTADEIRKVLIEDLGYAVKTARPLVRRIERNWQPERVKFYSNSEADMFKDLTFA